MTIKDAIIAIRNELSAISVPAVLLHEIGEPISRSLDLLSDCIFSIEKAEQEEERTKDDGRNVDAE